MDTPKINKRMCSCLLQQIIKHLLNNPDLFLFTTHTLYVVASKFQCMQQGRQAVQCDTIGVGFQMPPNPSLGLASDVGVGRKIAARRDDCECEMRTVQRAHMWDDETTMTVVLGPEIILVRGLVRLDPAVAYHCCLNLPATFSQPRTSIISGPSILQSFQHSVMFC